MGLWQRGADSIHNMRVINTDTLSHWNKLSEKCLQTSENQKTKKYLKYWL